MGQLIDFSFDKGVDEFFCMKYDLDFGTRAAFV